LFRSMMIEGFAKREALPTRPIGRGVVCVESKERIYWILGGAKHVSVCSWCARRVEWKASNTRLGWLDKVDGQEGSGMQPMGM